MMASPRAQAGGGGQSLLDNIIGAVVGDGAYEGGPTSPRLTQGMYESVLVMEEAEERLPNGGGANRPRANSEARN